MGGSFWRKTGRLCILPSVIIAGPISSRIARGGQAESDKVSVAIHVTQLPDIPVAVNDGFRVQEDNTLAADATPLFSVRKLDVAAQDLVYDPTGGQLYALVGQDVVPIDPETGAVGSPATVGGTPQDIAISDDGHYIYAVTNDGRSMRRFNTQTLAVDLTWDVGDFSYFGVAIRDIEPVPGRPSAVAVLQFYTCCSPAAGGIVIFEDGVALPANTAGGLGTSPGGDTRGRRPATVHAGGRKPDRQPVVRQPQPTETAFRQLAVPDVH
jgi:DNA-binding beta-propeller fold protein YncE